MNTVRVGDREYQVPVRFTDRAALANRVRELNPGASERDVAIVARALSAPPPKPASSRRFNAAPAAAKPTPMIEVGRGTRTRASDQRERVIINRAPRTKRSGARWRTRSQTR